MQHGFLLGKSGHTPECVGHPLAAHLLDVAAVASVMSQHGRASDLLAWCSSAFPAVKPDHAVAVFAGWHDLGKVADEFQTGRLVHGRPYPHGAWTRNLLAVPQASPPMTLASHAIGAHHGRFSQITTAEDRAKAPGVVAARPHAQTHLTRVLTTVGVAAPDIVARNGRGVESTVRVTLSFAALVSIADWVGSDTDVFPHLNRDLPPTEDAAYFREALDRARHHLKGRLLWDGWEPTPDTGFKASTGQSPRHAQSVVDSLFDTATGPTLTVLEAETGSGKTLSALRAAHRLAGEVGHTGLVVALPTQATASAMWDDVVSKWAPTVSTQSASAILAHGAAADNATLQQMRSQDDPDLDAPVGLFAPSWFSRASRSLFSTVAVATIDQLLNGVLRVKHGFLPLHALTNKVVVLDEAHSYDDYTGELMIRLIEWLAALGSSITVLSATMPSDLRHQIEAAWASGRRLSPPGPDSPEAAAYPVAHVTSDTAPTRTPLPSAEHRRITMRPCADLDAAASEVVASVTNGGCGLVVCNLVDDAVAQFDQHQETLGDDALLLHARYRRIERSRIESTVRRLFGPDPSHRPERAVLFSTQVVEQSLNVDFDTVGSALAPGGLLIQRIGRLWRFKQTPRPARFTAPSAYVPLPPTPTVRMGPPYDDLPVLLTWAWLRNHGAVLRVPDDVRDLVEATWPTTLSSQPANVPLDVWDDATSRWQELASGRKEAADAVAQRPPHSPFDPIRAFTYTQLDAEGEGLVAQTRLGRMPVPVVVLFDGGSGRTTLLPGDNEYVNVANTSAAGLSVLRSATVPASTVRLRGAALELPCPPEWQRTHLADHRLLIVGEDGEATDGAARLTYTVQRGLSIKDSH